MHLVMVHISANYALNTLLDFQVKLFPTFYDYLRLFYDYLRLDNEYLGRERHRTLVHGGVNTTIVFLCRHCGQRFADYESTICHQVGL